MQDQEVNYVIEQAIAAFPRFSNWTYSNEINESCLGFSSWGELTINDNKSISACYYITFDTYGKSWKGHLTIGQHSYFWSSADVGDAYLISTGNCIDVQSAIDALKNKITKLFDAFLANSDGK